MRRPKVSGRAAFAAAAAVVLAACQAEPPRGDASGGPGPDYTTTATIEEVMRYMIDPSADAIWDAVITEVSAEGVIDHIPETDEDWTELRKHAVTLIESTNLLVMPGRRVAAEGSRSEMPGVDLEPEEIEALLAENREAWAQFVGALHESGVTVLDAVDRRDVDRLLVAGDGLDLACENCHVRYWYPSLSNSAR